MDIFGFCQCFQRDNKGAPVKVKYEIPGFNVIDAGVRKDKLQCFYPGFERIEQGIVQVKKDGLNTEAGGQLLVPQFFGAAAGGLDRFIHDLRQAAFFKDFEGLFGSAALGGYVAP